MNRLLLSLFNILIISNVFGQFKRQEISLLPGEVWYGGCVSDGQLMPYVTGFKTDLYGNTKNNQVAPLLVSSKGRYIWSDQPFAFDISAGKLVLSNLHAEIITAEGGKTLREAFKAASSRFFRSSGKTPDEALFAHPQYNTWIELTYNQNQHDILAYAHGIIDHGLPPGVLMIDDSWAPYYGNFTFRKDRFEDAKAMIAELHQLGFKVMLWVSPFVSADSPTFRDLNERGLLLKDKDAPQKPALVNWWNGYSALPDFTIPAAVDWFKSQLKYMADTYGLDGFKFDAGDAVFYQHTLSKGNISPNEQSELWGMFGELYPLNEYRAMWKRGGQPLAERLLDKHHSWEDLQKLIPQITAAGLMGYQFTCPDMIGGGDWTSFRSNAKLDQDLIVRSAQVHALMPMMQFSVAPWRVLDEAHLAAVKKAVALRMQLTPYILQLARQCAQSGEPMARCLEYEFPDQGFEQVKDEFMLGDKYLVAPVVNKDGTRIILLPKGTWKNDTGKIFHGPQTLHENIPLDQLPWFEKLQ